MYSSASFLCIDVLSFSHSSDCVRVRFVLFVSFPNEHNEPSQSKQVLCHVSTPHTMRQLHWVFQLAILLFCVRFSSADCGGRDSGKPIVEILIWSGGSWSGLTHGDDYNTPNYLGHNVNKSTHALSCLRRMCNAHFYTTCTHISMHDTRTSHNAPFARAQARA